MTEHKERYRDRVAVVTGASRGIGLAIARRIVSEGGRVCLTAREHAPLAEACRQLGGDGHAIPVAIRGDDHEGVAAAVGQIMESFGRIDVLVNNVGINPTYGPLAGLDIEAARKVVDVNVLGSLAWVQEVYRASMAEHGGSIINVTSAAGLRPAENIGMYGASKAALMHMTQQLAWEMGPAVRVNAVAPGVVKTSFAAALYEGKETTVAAEYPLQRLGTPDDVANLVAFLASSEAAWITGQTVVVDGGLTLRAAI